MCVWGGGGGGERREETGIGRVVNYITSIFIFNPQILRNMLYRGSEVSTSLLTGHCLCPLLYPLVW